MPELVSERGAVERLPVDVAVLVDDVDSLAARAATVAADQGALQTRETYASVYRGFCAFVGPDAHADAFTRDRVRAYRDELERAGRSPATIAKHLSALRTLSLIHI